MFSLQRVPWSLRCAAPHAGWGSGMDAGLAWTAIGTVLAGVSVAVGWRQVHMEARRTGHERPVHQPGELTTLPVSVPVQRLPSALRGREALLGELRRCWRRHEIHAIVLAGMGGVGKSSVAAAFAEQISRRRRRLRRAYVWWVCAADPASVSGALATVAKQLGAPYRDIKAINAGAPDAVDRLWTRLHHTHRRWLLVFDNVDEPTVLTNPSVHTAAGKPGTAGDGIGWIRSSGRGLVLVTSRVSNGAAWGRCVNVVPVAPLDEASAALVLLDWAPRAGTAQDARELADRLGGLPLALRLAGSYLCSEVALCTSFQHYRHALDQPHERSRLLTVNPDMEGSTDSRALVIHTWELSLDSAARRGVPQARGLLRLLSCYAPASPTPLDLLDPQRLAPVLDYGATPSRAVSPTHTAARLEEALHQLNGLGLIQVERDGMAGADRRAVLIHPLICDTSRAHLLDAGIGGDASVIHRVAVDLIVAALAPLAFDRVEHWPRFLALGPHLHALLGFSALHVDQERLQELLDVTAQASAAHAWSGSLAEGEHLARIPSHLHARLGDEDRGTLLLRHLAAWPVALQGRIQEAETLYRGVLLERRRILGEQHPDTLSTYHELAWVAGIRKQWAQAETQYRAVLELRVRLLGGEHPDTLITRHELAWSIANQGRYDEAEALLLPVLATRQRVLGDRHPHTMCTVHELAWITAQRGHWAEAEAKYRQLLTARRGTLGENHHDTLVTRHELAWTLAAQGRHAAAADEYRRVLADRQRTLGPQHPDTVETQHALERLRSGQITPTFHIP